MNFTETSSSHRRAFAPAELAALRMAGENGWLTLTPDIGDGALDRWQHECERAGKAFAVVRLEPRRASLWFVLESGRDWLDDEQRRIGTALDGAKGFILTNNSVRAFADLGGEADIMRMLLAAVSPHH